MIIHKCEQRSPEWFMLRYGIPTASEFSRIITAKTGKLSASVDEYIGELILEEIGYVPDDTQVSEYSSPWMDRGAYIEEEARDWYSFYFDRDVEQVGLIMNDDESAAVSPDGLIIEAEEGGEIERFGLLEVKCPKPPKHIKYALQRVLPDEHRAQVHGALAISGAKWIDFLSYCPGLRPFVIRIEPNAYTEKVQEALAEFIARYQKAKAELIPDDQEKEAE